MHRSERPSGARNSRAASQTSTSLPDAPEPHNGPPTPPPPPPKPEPITLAGTPKRILLDQKAIWTSPLHLKPLDAMWLLPLAAVTGTMIGSDQHTMTALIHINANDQQHFTTISNAGVGALGLCPGTMYLWSLTHYAPQAKETGLLSGEALIDSLAVSEAIQLVSRRDRPNVNNAKGSFFSSSPLDASFPSNHAAAAWAMASVVGDEYPGWLTRTAVYGLATTVSVSRVLAEQHFPSDVLVGSVAGWLIGHYVYRAHHNFTLNPFDTGKRRTTSASSALTPPHNSTRTPPRPHRPSRSTTSRRRRRPGHHRLNQRPHGQLDLPGAREARCDGFHSWPEYRHPPLDPAGVSTATSPGRKSGRSERRVQPKPARASSPSDDRSSHRARIRAAYHGSLSLESVYARYGTIAGPALQDSFHFGQTWWNDFGRPLGRGSSAIAGFSFRAHDGRFFFYDRQELQHSPGNPAETPARNQLINMLDRSNRILIPHTASARQAAFDHQGAIELYGGVAFAGNSLSMGKQELYWGPTTMGPLAFSSNAEPTYNLRFVSTRPHPLP